LEKVGWFKKHILEKYEAPKVKEKEEFLQYSSDRDEWIQRHKGFRIRRIQSLVESRLLVGIVAALFLSVLALYIFSYLYPSGYNVSSIEGKYTVTPIPNSITVFLISIFAPVFVFLLFSFMAARHFIGISVDKSLSNGLVMKAELTDYLNRRWGTEFTNIRMMPEPEPLGSQILADKKTEIDAKLTNLKSKLENPPKQLNGKDLTEGEIEQYKVWVQRDIHKYTVAKERIDAYIEHKSTVWSTESKDHNYIWKTVGETVEKDPATGEERKTEERMIVGEVGFKIYWLVPGPTLEQCCFGWNDEKYFVGNKLKELPTMHAAAVIDFDPYVEIIEDDDSETTMMVDVPVFAVNNTPHSGLYYVWTASDGLLTNTVIDVPKSIDATRESEQLKAKLAKREQEILDMAHEKEMDQVSEETPKPSEPVDVTEPMKGTPQQPQQPALAPTKKHWNPFKIVGFIALVGICLATFGWAIPNIFHIAL
jgi:hypothetical protein